ncbi:MAG: ABC transporter ATP-binding protein [Leucobacter sp.]|nr:ABC transporter ATP-binding protein [Leucobacter sp.]
MIEFEAASVVVPTADGAATILQPTTLRLAEHRISIIGANGSGKSTLARLCNGLITPSSGRVRVRAGHDGELAGAVSQGQAVRTTHNDGAGWLDTAQQGAQVRRQVGFMFTDPAAQLIMPTAIEDVALSLRRSHKVKAQRMAAAAAALDRFGLSHLADRSVHTLSGGQRQLLALASVLAAEPTVLIADEPTTLLDLRNSLRIGQVLMGLPQQVIVVTHDLELAAQADRTIVVDDARVVFDGAPAAAIDFYRALITGQPPTQAPAGQRPAGASTQTPTQSLTDQAPAGSM